ncbi:uncharacterized protein ColSpa_12031 [Colletotrichum spaethianum]|uniref:Uncharacterized protein n=1 Tax=Colletotrichum spaethianum TaxID=700344 RepID=A0AA37PGY1_9PEZI|nr:uncharacterized protein ColSpa_12031 [Colletotrichum spaethianum]GKT51850.1 hypothetical protein ColSpa_12031 [Colletotrichum spaethianum]
MSRPRLLDCHPVQDNASTDFVKRFTNQETEERRKKRAASFTAEEHDALRKKFKTVHYISPNFADETKTNISVIRRKWKRFDFCGPCSIILLLMCQTATAKSNTS